MMVFYRCVLIYEAGDNDVSFQLLVITVPAAVEDVYTHSWSC